MVSAVAYSGAYPTGYGLYSISTEREPDRLHDRYQASGFTHFQQSGTGAIRKYYNYLRVTPMLGPLDELGSAWALHDEEARPGYYAVTLDSGIRCELTVGPKTAVHRYTFPDDPGSDDARIVLDLSCGGLAIPHGRTVPLRGSIELLDPGQARAQVMVEGVPLSVAVEGDLPGWRQMVWYDHRLVEGGNRLDLESIRRTTVRPFGLLFRGPADPEHPVEIRLGFSLRGQEAAAANLQRDGGGPSGSPTDGRVWSFDRCLAATEDAWTDVLDRIEVDGGTDDQRTVFATALYHSLIKPCFADDESPFWGGPGPFVFDLCTMWDIYKTQLPLLFALVPDQGADLLNALTKVCEEEGNYPIGYRMARGADRFFRQGSALAHTALADGFDLGLPGVDWELALVLMHDDLLRTYGEEFVDHGVVHPISHTLDLAYGYHCTARVARGLGDEALARSMDERATNWANAFDADTGLLLDSTFYEGGKWNYSFRLLHDMANRIELAGGDGAFTELLDRFFGVDRDGDGADRANELSERFEGLNNEPDMEAPYAYHYVGRPDRTAEIVHAALTTCFGPGRGGLPGNDDSGGLSSWYVWASLGLFPVAGQNLFLVSSPAFPRASIRIGDRTFSVRTSGFADTVDAANGVTGGARYVQQAWLDGEPLDVAAIPASRVHAGGELQLHLGPTPSKWGNDRRPPSLSTTSSMTTPAPEEVQ